MQNTKNIRRVLPLTKDKSFYLTLVKLAAPMALGNLITFLITLTDSLMIGRLGEEATAGVYIGGLVATVLQMFISGIEGGITVTSTQYWGKGEIGSIKKICGIGTLISLFFGLLVMGVSLLFPNALLSLFLSGKSSSDGAVYLSVLSLSFPFFVLSGSISSVFRSIEAPNISTFASAVAFIFNLFFDYLLIFGKLGFTSLGILGAAIATIIARAVEFSILFIYLVFIDKKLRMKPDAFLRFDKDTFKSFITHTSPIVGGQIIWIVNTLFSSYLLASLKSDSIVAALAVANTLNSLSYIVMNGMSSAVGIIIGKTIGENKIKKLREYTYTVEIIFIILGIICSLILFFIKEPFVSLYNISDMAKNTAKTLISVLSLTFIGTAYQSACLSGIVRGGGDVSFILKNDAFFIFLIVIPLSVTAFKLGAPVGIIFLALKSDQILKCIPAAIKINRFHWAKKLTE